MLKNDNGNSLARLCSHHRSRLRHRPIHRLCPSSAWHQKTSHLRHQHFKPRNHISPAPKVAPRPRSPSPRNRRIQRNLRAIRIPQDYRSFQPTRRHSQQRRYWRTKHSDPRNRALEMGQSHRRESQRRLALSTRSHTLYAQAASSGNRTTGQQRCDRQCSVDAWDRGLITKYPSVCLHVGEARCHG